MGKLLLHMPRGHGCVRQHTESTREHVRTRTEHGLVEDFSNIGGSPQRGDVGSAGDQICALTLRGKTMEKPQGDPKGTPQPK